MRQRDRPPPVRLLWAVALVALEVPVVLADLEALVDLAVDPAVLEVPAVPADPVDLAVLAVRLAAQEVLAADPMPCVSRCWTPRGVRQSWTTW
jgi:hypothetical protein